MKDGQTFPGDFQAKYYVKNLARLVTEEVPETWAEASQEPG